MVLFKTHLNFFCSLCLGNVVAGVRGSYYRMDVRWPID